MKICNLINHGYIDFGINLYKNLEKIKRHTDLILLCADEFTYKCVNSLNLKCEARLYKPLITTFFNDIKLPVNELYDPCYGDYYHYLNYIKYDAFYQILKEFKSAIYLDSDIAILDDFITDVEEFLKEKDFCITFENYPPGHESKGNMVNGGFFAVNLTPEVEDFYLETLEKVNNHEKYGEYFDMWYTTSTFRDHKDKLNWMVLPESIFILNHCGFRRTVKQILNSGTKAYHPTFFSLTEKVKQLQMLNCWYIESMFKDKNYVRRKGYEDARPKEL